MAYTKTVWKDYPDTTTKMTAQKLNNIEDGISALDTGKVNKTDKATGAEVVTGTEDTKYVTSKAIKDALVNLGAWTAYTPTTSGWVATPTTTGCKWTQIGKTVFCNFKVAGTSNAITARVALPVRAATGTDTEGVLGLTRDNGTYSTVAGRMVIDSTDYAVIQCYRDMSSLSWTNSGAKEVRGFIVYEAV